MNNFVRTAFILALGIGVSALSAAADTEVSEVPPVGESGGSVILTPRRLADLITQAAQQRAREHKPDGSLVSYALYPCTIVRNGVEAACTRLISDAAHAIIRATLASGAVVTLVVIGMHTDPAATKFALGAAGAGLVFVALSDLRKLVDGVKFALWL